MCRSHLPGEDPWPEVLLGAVPGPSPQAQPCTPRCEGLRQPSLPQLPWAWSGAGQHPGSALHSGAWAPPLPPWAACAPKGGAPQAFSCCLCTWYQGCLYPAGARRSRNKAGGPRGMLSQHQLACSRGASEAPTGVPVVPGSGPVFKWAWRRPTRGPGGPGVAPALGPPPVPEAGTPLGQTPAAPGEAPPAPRWWARPLPLSPLQAPSPWGQQ